MSSLHRRTNARVLHVGHVQALLRLLASKRVLLCHLLLTRQGLRGVGLKLVLVLLLLTLLLLQDSLLLGLDGARLQYEVNIRLRRDDGKSVLNLRVALKTL